VAHPESRDCNLLHGPPTDLDLPKYGGSIAYRHCSASCKQKEDHAKTVRPGLLSVADKFEIIPEARTCSLLRAKIAEPSHQKTLTRSDNPRQILILSKNH